MKTMPKRKIPRTTKYWQPMTRIPCPKCNQRATLYQRGRYTEELVICPDHTLYRTAQQWEEVELVEISKGLYKSLHREAPEVQDEAQLMNTGPTHSMMPPEMKQKYWDEQDEEAGY